jgi:hypothetical protein
MRILVLTAAVLLFVSFAPLQLALADGGVHVDYVGGTVQTIDSKAAGRIRTTDAEFFQLALSGKQEFRVPYDKINLLEYGQKVDRRYLVAALLSPMFLLSKSRQHFLTVGYTDAEGHQQAMVFRVAKGDVRTVLVTLEARTGVKVQYQDLEARKAGKG